MFIDNIKLVNFRNFDDKLINFKKDLNVIYGKNGVGKTNILEAIYLTCLTKSFRKADDISLSKDNILGYNVSLNYSLDDNFDELTSNTRKDNKIEIQYDTKTKKVYFNNELIKKSSFLIGKLNTLLYTPSDTYLFSCPPEDRRHLFNETISKVNYKYLYSLQRYKFLLKERNQLLIKETLDDDILRVYALELISNGYLIMTERRKLVININKRISYYYNLINDYSSFKSILDSNKDSNDENNKFDYPFKLKLTYVNNEKMIDNYQEYLDKMSKNFQENLSLERIKKQTLFGIHKDDFTLTINSKEINKFASQGQTKIATIALKLAIMDYLIKETKTKPVVLLDDITSDLDEVRLESLFKVLEELDQVILTTSYLDKNVLSKYNTNLINLE